MKKPETNSKATDKKIVTVCFSLKAWAKMHELVKEFSTEVEWHGTVKRISKNEFFVEDILLFPHNISASFIHSDQTKYDQWSRSLDDETFNKCRLHGHSHVYGPSRPSSHDDKYNKRILNNFGTPSKHYDCFYIFIILNKKGDLHCAVYDLTNNVKYNSEDVKITTNFDDSISLEAFITEARALIFETTNTAILEDFKKEDRLCIDYDKTIRSES